MYAGVNSLDNTRGLGGDGVIPALVHLRILSLPDNQIRQLDSLAGCIELQVVDLSQNYIDDLNALSKAFPSSLRALNISHNHVKSISGLLHMSSLTHLMHLFVTGCPFASAATDARIDVNSFLASLLPDLVSVDNVTLSPIHRTQGKMLQNRLALLHRMSDQQVIHFLSGVFHVPANESYPASAADAVAHPFSDFADDGDEDTRHITEIPAAESVVHLPHSPSMTASAYAPVTSFPSAKSVNALAHDISRLKNKLASFASQSPAPPLRSIVASLPSIPSSSVTGQPHFVSAINKISSVAHSPSHDNINASAASATARGLSLLHSSATIITRAWRSSRIRRLVQSGKNQGRAGCSYPMAALVGDNLVMKRLELLEKTVAMQLHVIEKLHASLSRVNAAPAPFPVWRIVADCTAAATLIQSVWRGHIDREVVQVIRERMQHRILIFESLESSSRSAAAATIAAFFRRKRAEDSAKWMFLAISSDCLYRLVCNMGDRILLLEQKLFQLTGGAE
jgi:hypothetical protein